ncbi:uncharacterized protein [Dendrobates tinctorius]|uniref:uncharacterized protein isoform X2 n=1 Tax=Dendrobates tinctorius TaxID=92724 RepID=UPI003CC95DB7
MDKDKMAERILHLTLEILFRLTGEDYTVVKKTSRERCQDPVSEGWETPLSPITGPPPHPLIHEDINDQKILELTYKMIELLTGEVPIRCQDVTIYFSMEEWEYLEGHKDLYKDVMMEVHQPLTSPDLSSERTTPERCPRPLLPQDCKQEDPIVPQDHQGEDLPHINATETYVRSDERCKEEIPTDNRTDPLRKNPSGRSRTVRPQQNRQAAAEPPYNLVLNPFRKDHTGRSRTSRSQQNRQAATEPPGRSRIPIQPCSQSFQEGPARPQQSRPASQAAGMSSSESSPSHHQRTEEAEAEELPGGDMQGGEIQGGGAQSSSQSGALTRVTPRTSQRCRGAASGGRRTVSQRAPQRALEEALIIDVDDLIQAVQPREPLWNMANRYHANQPTTRRLWDEVCFKVVENWEELDARARDFVRDRVITRWRSLRDRFKRDFNKEMQAPSGSGGRRSTQYKNYRALVFLQSTMVSRSTVCSTREPASELLPSGGIPCKTAPGDHIEVSDPSLPSLLSRPSFPSTSTGAAGQTSSHEAAGDDLQYPLPHPSDTAATSRPTFGSGRQCLRGQERMTLSDCLSLNSSVQQDFHTYGQQLSSGLTMINQSIMELRRYMERMNLESKQTPRHIFFQSVVRQMEGLSTHQQMRVMQACHNALVEVLSEASHPPPVHPPPVHPPTTIHHATIPPPTTPSPFSSSPFHSSQYLPSPLHYTPMPSPYPPPHTPSMFPQTSSVHPLLSQPHVFNPPSTSDPHQLPSQSSTPPPRCGQPC